VSDLLLRPATAHDVPKIAAVVQAAYGHYPDRIGGRPRPLDDDYGAAVEKHRVSVAEREGEICGVVVLAIERGTEFWIDNVAVRPAQQGTGVGRALLEHAEAVARADGYEAVNLLTHELMIENLPLYARIGYVEYERRPSRRSVLICMRKRLAHPHDQIDRVSGQGGR
jgi:GNAT superfamily N-acetyltransferase